MTATDPNGQPYEWTQSGEWVYQNNIGAVPSLTPGGSPLFNGPDSPGKPATPQGKQSFGCFDPVVASKAGIGCGLSEVDLPRPCFVGFEFQGTEVDAGETGGFVGNIWETYSDGGADFGSLLEFWMGGEGGQVGGALTNSAAGKGIGGFTFAGIGLSAGPLAGGQIGLYAEKNGAGVYAEGHHGPGAGGVGLGLTSCP